MNSIFELEHRFVNFINGIGTQRNVEKPTTTYISTSSLYRTVQDKKKTIAHKDLLNSNATNYLKLSHSVISNDVLSGFFTFKNHWLIHVPSFIKSLA